MADNSNYQFGLDAYADNKLPDWNQLNVWDKKVRFLYFRLGLGVIEDDMSMLLDAAAHTDWHLGVYYAMWTPLLAKDRQLKAISDNLPKVKSILRLPFALDFEPEVDWIRGKPVKSWPSVGDLQYLATTLANQGLRTLVYTNLSGLDVIKANGSMDMPNVDWWIARYYGWPMWSTEMSVDDTLAILLSKYGIPKERVQFMQTIGDHGAYPDGTSGADYDRAVSYIFDAAPLPPPFPSTCPDIKSIDIKVTDNKLDSVLVTWDTNAVGDYTQQSKLRVPQNPAPTPQPVPEVQNDIYYYISKTQIIENGLTTGDPPQTTPAVMRIDDQPKDSWPEVAGKKGNSSPLTDSRKAFVVDLNQSDPRGAHYVNETVGAMIVNSPGHCESISCQHNFLSGPGVLLNNAYKLNCFQSDEDFKQFIGKVSFDSRPDLIFKCLAENIKGQFSKVGNAIDAYSPLVACSKADGGTGELWIGAEYVEPFPTLPLEVVILGSALMVHSGPTFDPTTIVGKVQPGDKVTIYAYRPIGASVFGMINPGGWICLMDRRTSSTGTFYTTWKIDTEGVIP